MVRIQLSMCVTLDAHGHRYDALTTSNKVSYQNALNSSNITFASASGRLLTNYCWTETDAATSRQIASDNKIPHRDIFFGIDVWAQNASKLTHPRVTYPEKGGGGTNTGIAVTKVAELGLSAGIFAPAWSFEHFPHHGRAVEQAMWEGKSFSEDTECSCGNGSTRHQPNIDFPILRSAKEFPAGSESFFYADFSRAWCEHKVEDNNVVLGCHTRHSQLCAQSILPCPPDLSNNDEGIDLSRRLVDSDGRAMLIVEAQQKISLTADNHLEQLLPLYKFDMPANGSLHFMASCRKLLLSTTGASIGFYLKTTRGLQSLPIPENNSLQSIQTTVGMASHLTADDRLQELGIHLRGCTNDVGEAVQLLEIFELGILPESAVQKSQLFSISDIRVEHRGQGETTHARLCWSFNGTSDAEARVEGLPYSKVTGPVSYFNIQVGGLRLGRAYAMEHPLVQSLVERFMGREMKVDITGISFDGRQLVHSKTVLHV